MPSLSHWRAAVLAERDALGLLPALLLFSLLSFFKACYLGSTDLQTVSQHLPGWPGHWPGPLDFCRRALAGGDPESNPRVLGANKQFHTGKPCK